jgi:YVTN family beta-propeller protein
MEVRSVCKHLQPLALIRSCGIASPSSQNLLRRGTEKGGAAAHRSLGAAGASGRSDWRDTGFPNGQFADVTVGGLNQVKVFRTADFSLVATIPVGKLPHGVWPSGDGTRVYVGLENNDLLTAIDTLTNRVIATVPIGQAAQAVAYVPGAVPQGDGTQGLQPLVSRVRRPTSGWCRRAAIRPAPRRRPA